MLKSFYLLSSACICAVELLARLWGGVGDSKAILPPLETPRAGEIDSEYSSVMPRSETNCAKPLIYWRFAPNRLLAATQV